MLERPASSREPVGERAPAESSLTGPERPAEAAGSRRGAGALALDVLAQTGWSVLALAGAFLVRALTDRGTMATTPGVALGLAYALGVIVLADRSAGRGNRLTAGFLGSTGVFIANAIVAETTTRFGIFSVGAGLAVLAGATAFALAACPTSRPARGRLDGHVCRVRYRRLSCDLFGRGGPGRPAAARARDRNALAGSGPLGLAAHCVATDSLRRRPLPLGDIGRPDPVGDRRRRSARRDDARARPCAALAGQRAVADAHGAPGDRRPCDRAIALRALRGSRRGHSSDAGARRRGASGRDRARVRRRQLRPCLPPRARAGGSGKPPLLGLARPRARPDRERRPSADSRSRTAVVAAGSRGGDDRPALRASHPAGPRGRLRGRGDLRLGTHEGVGSRLHGGRDRPCAPRRAVASDAGGRGRSRRPAASGAACRRPPSGPECGALRGDGPRRGGGSRAAASGGRPPRPAAPGAAHGRAQCVGIHSCPALALDGPQRAPHARLRCARGWRLEASRPGSAVGHADDPLRRVRLLRRRAAAGSPPDERGEPRALRLDHGFDLTH